MKGAVESKGGFAYEFTEEELKTAKITWSYAADVISDEVIVSIDKKSDGSFEDTSSNLKDAKAYDGIKNLTKADSVVKVKIEVKDNTAGNAKTTTYILHVTIK